MVVYLLDAQVENRIAESDLKPLTEDEHCRLLQSLARAVEDLPGPAVILTPLGARRKLRHLIEKELPSLAILAYQEIFPDMNVQPLARLDLSSASLA